MFVSRSRVTDHSHPRAQDEVSERKMKVSLKKAKILKLVDTSSNIENRKN